MIRNAQPGSSQRPPRGQARSPAMAGGNQLIATHSDHFVYDWYGTPEHRAVMRREAD